MGKKICMIAYSNFSSDPRIRRESEVLAEHGNEVNFLTLAEENQPKIYKKNGVRVIELNLRKHQGQKSTSYLLPYLKFLGMAFWHCSKLFLQGKVDVVHVHNMPNFLVLAGILPRLFGKKLILDIHDSVPETYGSKFEVMPRALHRLLCLEEYLSCRFANQLICVNDIQKEKLVERGIRASKLSVILNVPDHKIFKFGKDEPVNHKKTFDLVYHGTIDKILGVDLAIEVVSRLVKDIPGIRLHVLGKGRSLEEFGQLAEKLRVKNRVHFSNRTYPVEMLPHLLRCMDVGVIPNKKNMATELMLPVKMMEYVAIGIPVVSARLKTIEHYFPDNMVTYFEPENAESMASAILSLYHRKDRRDAQTIHAKTFIEKYGWENHQRELIRLYEEL